MEALGGDEEDQAVHHQVHQCMARSRGISSHGPAREGSWNEMERSHVEEEQEYDAYEAGNVDAD